MKDLMPSLVNVINTEKLHVETISLTLPMDVEQNPGVSDRSKVRLSDTEGRGGEWRVPSLRALFRGDKIPPQDMDHYPEEYSAMFFVIEKNVLFAGDFIDIRDEEIARLYSLVRRKPDGRSEGVLHDVLYQSAALILGLQAVSQAEFEAIFDQLVASARGWRESYSSRNYIAYLRETFRQDENEHSGRAQLVDRMRKSFPLEKGQIVESTGEKMSEVILDFAGPLLDRARNKQEKESVLGMAILVWNATFVSGKQEILKELKGCSVPLDGKEQGKFDAVTEEVVDFLWERKNTLFGKYQKCISDYQLELTKDGIIFNVGSFDVSDQKQGHEEKVTSKGLFGKIRNKFKGQ
ncbi:MAG: hypothetical protein HQL20_05930 [Candidatus Omnitrophica bacterium]|nr:hypothetical protein [Candidatus Omnitrophota bacterium]